METNRRHLVIVGAGPIGLEAALYACERGDDVTVLERGRVAENVRQWGHVRLFSPFAWNASKWGRARLSAVVGETELPGDEELLSGREMAERYWLPLSQLPELRGRIREGCDVQAIGRANLWKGDCIGQPSRGDDSFQILVRDSDGEWVILADYVLDCSGTYPNHNWMGAGGLPCVGERDLLPIVEYRLPDVLGKDRDRYAGKRTLVVGGGYSAATAVVNLVRLAESAASTEVVWLTRSEREPPLARIEADSLPERDRLAAAANALACSEGGPVRWLNARLIKRIEPGANGAGHTVSVCGRQSPERSERDLETLSVDNIIANVGYRPDRGLYRELQIHECYASEGPMKLAAALLGETSYDCTVQQSHGAQTLVNPEPGFYVLGSKSYGRNSRFLLRIGIQQIVDVFSLLPKHGNCKPI